MRTLYSSCAALLHVRQRIMPMLPFGCASETCKVSCVVAYRTICLLVQAIAVYLGTCPLSREQQQYDRQLTHQKLLKSGTVQWADRVPHACWDA